MACDLEEDDVITMVIAAFKLGSTKVVTPDTPLTEWDSITKRAIFLRLRDDLEAQGCGLQTLEVEDVNDPDKVGENIGDLGAALHKDLEPLDAKAARGVDARRTPSVSGRIDRHLAAYLAGYRDGTLQVIAMLLGEVPRRSREPAESPVVTTPRARQPKAPATKRATKKRGATKR